MPKYTEFLVANHNLYFTSHCIIEPIHVHASDKKLTESNSAKIWVYKNGDTEIKNWGNLTQHEMNEIRTYIKENIEIIRYKWKEFAGNENFKRK